MNLSPGEQAAVNDMLKRAQLNLRALELFSRYLNYCPRYAQQRDLMELQQATGLQQQEAYSLLVCAACGLDGDENADDRELERRYFLQGIHCMNVQEVRADPYCQTISMPEAVNGDWEFGYKHIEAYEAFPSDDPLLMKDGREIPQAAYFTEAFDAPVVKQYGREWMTVTPSERNTMLDDIARVSGKVAVFGLGLGYYVFMTALRPEVREIVVIERDQKVIDLFTQYLLPQFPNKEKICIVCADGFEFAANMASEAFDWAYVDIWHDVLDGAEMYLRMKQLEHFTPHTSFCYWIEKSILAWLRSMFLFEVQEGEGPLYDMLSDITTAQELKQRLSNDSLKKLAKKIPLSAIAR